MKLLKEETLLSVEKKLADKTGCTKQHTGWSCGSCFHSMDIDLEQPSNDSESLLDSLLFTAKENWKIEPDSLMENINKILFIFNSYIKLFYKNYTLVFATIYQLIT